jgi:acetyltransferase
MELDPTFGPVIVLGHAALGPTSGELAYLLPPLDSTLVHAMLDETGIGRFLLRQPNGEALSERVVETLVRLSQLVVDLPTVSRVAIDPLVVSRDRLVVLDAHIDLAPVPPGTDPVARLSIRPYPRELEQTATLRDGRKIRLRPIRPEDAPALKALFEALTPEDRRRRLFSSVREISDEFAARLTQIDYDREMVLVALDPANPEVFLGGARIAADADNRRAEYSVTIRSDQQGLGLGRICFERVLDYARSRGIEEVWGSVLAENEGMLGLAERLGFTRRRDPEMPDVFITTRRLA